MEIIINIENATPETIEEVFERFGELLNEDKVDLEVNYAEECNVEEDICCQCDSCQGCCDDECEYYEDESDEFTVEDLCTYVLIEKLDNCNSMEEEVNVLRELYDTAFEEGYQKAIQDDIEFKMDLLDDLQNE